MISILYFRNSFLTCSILTVTVNVSQRRFQYTTVSLLPTVIQCYDGMMIKSIQWRQMQLNKLLMKNSITCSRELKFQ